MVDACDFLSIEKPVLQGAMGAVARQDLVVAVSKAGGLGTLGYLPPSFFEQELGQIEERLAGRSFAANLLMPIISKQHVEAVLGSNVPIVTLFFGFDEQIVSALKEAGKIVLFQIGSLEEAEQVIHAGADGVIVQGHEAGGHIRGQHRLSELLPRVKEAFPDHLVCGAGGIFDGGSADACRALGADGVCAGTRFLASPEAAAHVAYKDRLIEASDTVVTNLFGVGWSDPHRVIANAAVRKWCEPDGIGSDWLPMNAVAERMAASLGRVADRSAITARQNLDTPLYTPSPLTPEMEEHMLEVVALYAGECVGHIHELKPAGDTVRELA